MQIIWLTTALNNLDELAEYIAQENPQAARQVLELIETQVNQAPNYEDFF